LKLRTIAKKWQKTLGVAFLPHYVDRCAIERR